ncbi:unnamed protein product [Citrullus colocynthis]|uniref:Uncharacterized protein n=1 Tax=Citrullus colocynthis TaxID=252529 RepID=A0ABP0YIU6_9ROSI
MARKKALVGSVSWVGKNIGFSPAVIGYLLMRFASIFPSPEYSCSHDTGDGSNSSTCVCTFALPQDLTKSNQMDLLSRSFQLWQGIGHQTRTSEVGATDPSEVLTSALYDLQEENTMTSNVLLQVSLSRQWRAEVLSLYKSPMYFLYFFLGSYMLMNFILSY